MLSKFLTYLFGCTHKNFGWPLTIKRYNLTYRVCLDCGTAKKYDWEKMEFVKSTPQEQQLLMKRLQIRIV